ncbi:MAG: hypothetical protein KDA77_18730, partial [Planctomycetaceae bacterium]|nr:hypothetical protein [Planctomycetaceae bacterium]
MSTYSVKKSVAAGISQGSWGDRAAVWVGGIMLIGPLLIWLYGVATGQHFADSVTEMTLVSALFFCPLGLLVMVCGIQNLVPPTSKAAKFMDGLFLMACFFAGPVGILLYIARYIKRRDERSETQLETKSVVPSTDAFIQENRRSNKRVILGVVFGVSLLLSSVLFVQIWQHLNKTEQYWILNWGGKLLVVCGMFIAAYLIKRKAESAAMNNPWKVMGWITTLLAGLLVLSMLMQVNAPGSDEVVIDYDVNYPVMFISTEAGEKKYVRSRPFTFKLPPGKHELVITFKMGDDYRKFTRTIEKIAGKQLKINLAPVIQAYVNYDKNQKLEAAEREKNRGALVLSGQEPGLRVGVFPVDPMQTRSGDGVFGFSDQFFTLETVTHEVPAGKYLIRVSSELTGWEIDGENPKYDLAEIEVKPGTVVPVTITRDYQKLARNHPNWSKGGLFKFRWPDSKLGSRQVYTLSVTDALVVQQLFEAFADGKPDVAEADLLETASTGFNPEKYDSLEQFF